MHIHTHKNDSELVRKLQFFYGGNKSHEMSCVLSRLNILKNKNIQMQSSYMTIFQLPNFLARLAFCFSVDLQQ